MWITREKYDELLKKTELLVEKANKYDMITDHVRHNSILIFDDMYCMSSNTFNNAMAENVSRQNEIRELEAKLVWFQHQYIDLKEQLKKLKEQE